MLIEHEGARPRLHPTAWVAPTATLCGDVSVGPGARVMHGAQLVAEGGPIAVGRNGIVLENAVLRGAPGRPLTLGDDCLVGPHAHLVGCTVEDEVFVATGAAVFHGARLGRGSEVRVHGVVHLRSRLAEGTVVPIGWIAVGDPAEILPPDAHERVWAIQEPLDFPGTVYGIPRSEATMRAITRRVSERLGGHVGAAPLA